MHLLENTVLPEGLKLIEVQYPDIIECEAIKEADLAANWTSDLVITRNCGDDWLQRCKTAIVAVPSAIAPNTRNFLFNPRHPDAHHIRIERYLEFDLDRRIKRLAEYAFSYRDEPSYVLRED